MSKVNQVRSAAAKAADQQGGLHSQRRGGQSVDLQRQLVSLAVKYPGYTIDQLSWMVAGFEVDANGVCQPSGLYSKAQKYFNGKRRGCEISFNSFEKVKDEAGNQHLVNLSDAQIKAKHPHAQLVYGKALNNPYTDKGGRGVRLISVSTSINSPDVASIPKPSLSEGVAPSYVGVIEQAGCSEIQPANVESLPEVVPVNAASHIESLKDMLDD